MILDFCRALDTCTGSVPERTTAVHFTFNEQTNDFMYDIFFKVFTSSHKMAVVQRNSNHIYRFFSHSENLKRQSFITPHGGTRTLTLWQAYSDSLFILIRESVLSPYCFSAVNKQRWSLILHSYLQKLAKNINSASVCACVSMSDLHWLPSLTEVCEVGCFLTEHVWDA